ncbi:MAG: hypothetical protein K0U15_00170, partial [Proteobacteria bacterium]|nr:hypothetical protein [Pseudomonadota bacterium]
MTAVNENNEIISYRDAAFIIAPGIYGEGDSGGRIAEDLLYGGVGVPPAKVSVTLHESYLDEGSYAGFAGLGGETVSILTNLNDAVVNASSALYQRNNADSIDKVEYITVDELVADGFKGIDILEKAQENIYDIAEGKGAFLGVQELLENHLNRYGFLPEPAVFDEGVINQRNRPSGAPAQITITASYNYENISADNTVTISMTLSDPLAPFTPTATIDIATVTSYITTTMDVDAELPFQQGARISTASDWTVAIRVSDLPPVFLAEGARLRGVVDRGAIPIPYGAGLAALETALNIQPLANSVVLDLSTSHHYPDQGFAGLGATVLVSATFNPVPSSPVIMFQGESNLDLRPGLEFLVILADSGYGYFMDETLIDLVSYPNGKSTMDIAQLPPGALRVLLPAGTRLTLQSDNIVVRLPAEFALPPGSTFDQVSGEWVLNSGSDLALEIFASDNRWISVDNLPSGLPVVAGDMGLLPVEEAVVQTDPVGSTVELASDKNSISRLAVDTLFYTDSDLIIVPFTPFGRPVFDEGNQNQESLVTPYRIDSGERFQVPPGARVIYPKNATFTTGDVFNFPDDSILQFPPGAIVEVGTFPQAVLPGGQQLKNLNAQNNVLITLVHGGLVNLATGVRLNAEGSDILSSAQKLFDVELRGANKVAGADVDSGTILRPFIHQRMVPPPAISIIIGDSAVFSSENYIRAGFLTRPRNVRVPMPQTAHPLGPTDDLLIESPYNTPEVFTNLRGIYDVDQVALLTYQGVSNPPVTIEFDEDTQFYIPPGRGVSLTVGAFSIGGVAITAMRSVQLPRGTGIFDIDASPALYELSISISSPDTQNPQLFVTSEDTEIELVQEGEVVYEYVPALGANTITVTASHVLENRLVLYPETDMYMFIGGTVSLVAAGSIVDLLDGVIYSQVGVQRINRVAEDLGVRSSG